MFRFLAWCVIFYAFLMLLFFEPGLTFLLIMLSLLVGLMMLPFVVFGLALKGLND